MVFFGFGLGSPKKAQGKEAKRCKAKRQKGARQKGASLGKKEAKRCQLNK